MNGRIDLFSDTASKPTEEMLRAMCQAQLGDEQRRDDPTVNALEERVAALLEKEAALLVPSATMANQIAVWLHCPFGGELVCHRSAHVYNYEAGGLALHARVQAHPVDGEGGFFDGDTLRAAMRFAEPHLAQTRAVTVENTTNVAGGRVWPDAAFSSVVDAARELGLAIHLDGARLWNAARKRAVPVGYWSREVDTVSVCFSKGLGCPFGAVLAGRRAAIEQARWLKQSMGGALRQAGVIAAAMIYALDHHLERLDIDHQRIERVASALGAVSELRVYPPETNMLFFEHSRLTAVQFVQAAAERGLLLSEVEGRVRLCTHLSVDEQQLTEAIAIVVDVAISGAGDNVDETQPGAR